MSCPCDIICRNGPIREMTLLIAVKCSTSGSKQTTKQLTKYDAIPGKKLHGWCVHAIGGESATTITPNRRETVRKCHNKNKANGRCCKHKNNWKAILKRQFNITVPVQVRRVRPQGVQVQAAQGIQAAPPEVQAVPQEGEQHGVYCSVCLDSPPQWHLSPCGHVCLCTDCYNDLQSRATAMHPMQCPHCRTIVRRGRRAFL